jgi:hypothetical protein
MVVAYTPFIRSSPSLSRNIAEANVTEAAAGCLEILTRQINK